MKTFIAALGTETNTLSPIPTGWAASRECVVRRGTGSTEGSYHFARPMRVWRREAERRGRAVAESLSAFAQPAGPTTRAVWEELRDAVLDDLAAAGPVDLVLLHLHGAMVAEGRDDCEGDLLRRVRDRVGPKAVVGVELDLHGHLTAAMVAASTLVVLSKDYPHVDVADRALDLFALCDDALHGRTAPVMALHDCRMLGVWRTATEPSRALRVRRDAGQSFAGGRQPMGDAVLLAVQGLHVAVNAVRTQTFHPDAFEQFGVALRDRSVVAVKSAQHFAAGFGPACDRILYVAAPGTASPDVAALHLPRAGRPLWPQVADPFAPQPNP